MITGLEVGGAETALARLLAVTRERGARALVVALRGGGLLEREIRALGIPVVALRRPLRDRDAGDTGVVAALRACRDFRPQFVVGWMYHGIALGWLLGFLTARGRPVVWNVRCTLDAREFWPRSTRMLVRALRAASRWAHVIVYNSERGRDQHRSFGFAGSRIRVIDNGVDVRAFAPDAAVRESVRVALGIPGDAIVIGHVARFDPQKGHALFLEALLHLRTSDRVHVVMAGRHVTRDNPALRGLLDRVASRITLHLLGERRDVADLMRAFDVFCMSSNSGEGFPNVVAEAMASGVPCVVTDVGDAARVVGTTGRCVASDDVPAMAAALDELCLSTPQVREALSRGATERVRELFSTARMADEYADVFVALSGANPEPGPKHARRHPQE